MKIKKLLATIAATAMIIVFGLLVSCEKDDINSGTHEIAFRFGAPQENGNSGGRLSSEIVPAGVLVTIHDGDGNLVVEKKRIAVYQFGDSYMSVPLTMATTGTRYRLTEFFVLGPDSTIRWATPREGSKLDHLVEDPLDIEFSIFQHVVTTVTPEVLLVSPASNPADYGYGQFGFHTVETIDVVLSSFIKAPAGLMLTGSHATIEGLQDTTANGATALWRYEVDLQAKANILTLKKFSRYRMVVKKEGYNDWTTVASLNDQDAVEVIFEKAADAFDVYVSGQESLKAGYWKNGERIKLSDMNGSVVRSMFVLGSDVYVAGYENLSSNAMYWKNGAKIVLAHKGLSAKVMVGDEVHVIGHTSGSNGSWYWKNGVLSTLAGTGNYDRVTVTDMTLSGEDVYISGHEGNITTTNDADSSPLLWKNEVVTTLPLPSAAYRRTFTHAVVVSDGHVYVTGTTVDPVTGRLRAVYWKDGVVNVFGAPDTDTRAGDIKIIDGRVHIVGTTNVWISPNTPAYWIDGVEVGIQPRSNINDKTGGIDFLENHIAISGSNKGIACYWLNGQRIDLSDKPSAGGTIILMKR